MLRVVVALIVCALLRLLVLVDDQTAEHARAGTTWKYRDRSASSGITNATVRPTKPVGTLRVQLNARGLALGAAPVGTPPVASIAFGAPTAAPGQCGVTAFAACRTTANGATVRCP